MAGKSKILQIQREKEATEGATVAVSGVCSKTLVDLGEGIYDIMCPAALGETDVIVSATKGTLTATNTTKINVKPRANADQGLIYVAIGIIFVGAVAACFSMLHR